MIDGQLLAAFSTIMGSLVTIYNDLYKLKTINLYRASLSTSEHIQPTLPMVSTTVGRSPAVLRADLQHCTVVVFCAAHGVLSGWALHSAEMASQTA